MSTPPEDTTVYKGTPVLDGAGRVLGSVEAIEGDWIVLETVEPGRVPDSRRVRVPARGARKTELGVVVTTPGSEVADLTEIGEDAHPTREMSTLERSAPVPADAPAAGGDDWMTVSEERMELDTVVRPYERVRLVKRIVEDEVTLTVRLKREVVEIVKEDIDPATVAGTVAGQHELVQGDAETTILLLAEEPVVSTKVVPLERVRVTKTTVTDEVRVTDALKREQVELVRDPVDE